MGERLHKVLGQIDLGTLDSGERSLPFGLLVLISESYHGLSSGLINTFLDGIQERTKLKKISLNLLQASSRVPCLKQFQS